MANMKRLSDDEVKKNVIHAKVSNIELDGIRSILEVSECLNMADLIRTSIFFYGNSIKSIEKSHKIISGGY